MLVQVCMCVRKKSSFVLLLPPNNTLNRQVSFTVGVLDHRGQYLDHKGLYQFAKNCDAFCDALEKRIFFFTRGYIRVKAKLRGLIGYFVKSIDQPIGWVQNSFIHKSILRLPCLINTFSCVDLVLRETVHIRREVRFNNCFR